MQRLDLKKLNDVEQQQVKISNKCAALVNSDDDMDINEAWENIRVSKFQPKQVQVNTS